MNIFRFFCHFFQLVLASAQSAWEFRGVPGIADVLIAQVLPASPSDAELRVLRRRLKAQLLTAIEAYAEEDKQ